MNVKEYIVFVLRDMGFNGEVAFNAPLALTVHV
mgnify:CR=1 FL=1